jgi:propionyl-CoA synthetase
MSEAYSRAWRDSIEQPERFWSEAAKALEWTSAPSRVWDEDGGWFPDGTLNTAHNCLDRHVAAGGAKPPR